jgi:heme-degrading monooxygenase HmoA
MIVRVWLTGIDELRAEEYTQVANQKSVPMFRAQPGFAGVLFTARAGGRAVITFWEDHASAEALDTSATYKTTIAAIEATGCKDTAQSTSSNWRAL